MSILVLLVDHVCSDQPDHHSEGKIKHIGLSEVTSATLRRAYKIAPVAAVQLEYSPFVLEVERPEGTHLLDTCRELGVSLVCYSPLGRGMLTSNFVANVDVVDKTDPRQVALPRFQDANRTANAKLVTQFGELAKKKGCSMPQLALAWLLKQGDHVIPNPGTTKIKYLEDNWGALDLQLTDEEEKEIRKFVETAEVAGDRKPPGQNRGQHGSLIDTVEEK